MKNKLIIILGLAALLGLGSCNKFLDTLPDSRLEIDTPEKVGMLLTSSYSLGIPAAMLELMSDNTADNGVNYGIRYELVAEAYLYKDHSLTRDDTPHDLWQTCYKAITTANTALQAIDKLEDQGYELDAYRAEARISRAWSYFMLVNTFCHAYNPISSSTDIGIPYLTVPVSDVFAKFDRGTVKEVWDKMDEDIEAALPYIDDDIYSIPKNHFNRKAAYCFAAEFNLYYGNYDKAIRYANVVLGDKPASLLRDMKTINAQTSSANTRVEYVRYDLPCNLMVMSTNSSWGRVHASSTYARYMHNRELSNLGTFRSQGPWNDKNGEQYKPAYLSLFKLYSSGDVMMYYPKMSSFSESSGEGTAYYYVVWIPFTVEKALLTRAEAYVMKERYDEAADDLSMWYTSRNATSIVRSADEISEFYRGYTTDVGGDQVYQGAVMGQTKFELNPRITIQDGMQNEMIQAVIHARRLEYIHEGWRLLDLKRFGIPFKHNVDRATDIQLEPWDNRLLVQLPFMVLAAGMEPNPR